MQSTPAIVSLEHAAVDIDGTRVLHDICLEISAGCHLGVVGDNGSGKSTLLALIAGRRWPAPGRGSRVYDFGNGPERDAVTARERIALIGHELQDLYVARSWNFRVRNIVHSGLTRTDIPQRRATAASEQEALDLLESMSLGHLAERRLLELSRGEQRRVLITRALAFRPAILLLDEPVSGLDAASRAALEQMLGLASQQTQIVIAAHRRDELPEFMADVIMLENGRLQAVGYGPDPALSRDNTRAPQTARSAASAPAKGKPGHEPETDNDRVVIELENASVWLGERQVLRSLNWRLERGEHWMVTGPNGAGKSTFLRLLHAELRPSRGGSIRWPGLGDPRNVWTLRRQIALVSPELQARYRYPSSVLEAVASGLHSSIGLVGRLTPDELEQVETLLESFELTHFRARALSSLSYGQRHRTLIARCLITDPRIVLLDEPWEGLDARTRDIVTSELSRRMAEGMQIVCASHIGAAGLEFNRELELENGAIVRAGDSVGPRGSSASVPTRAAGSPQR